MMAGEPDKFYAKTAFYLGLGFWIPLFNLPLCVMAMYLGTKALRLAISDPRQYAGRGYAIAGIVLGVAGLVFTVIGALIYLLSGTVCESAICSAPL